MTNRKNALMIALVVTGAALLLQACNNQCEYSGGGQCLEEGDGQNSEDNNNDNNDNSDGNADNSPPEIDYLDCSSLDPGKVYIMGPIAPKTSGERNIVIADPEDPESYCLGFPGRDSSDGDMAYIDHTGQVYFGFSGDIYSFVEDTLYYDDSRLAYPEAPIENDTLVRSQPENCGYLSLLKFNPTDNSKYHFNCDYNSEIHSDSADYYYDNPEENTDLHATFPDNSILINPEWEYLSVVRPDQSIVELSLPESSDEVRRYEGSRYVSDGDNSRIMLIVIYLDPISGDEYAGRWSININTLEVTDDGLFSEKSEQAESTYNRTELDAEGNMYQIFFSDNGMSVMKRYLVSSESETEIIYDRSADEVNGENWRDGLPAFGTVSSGSLVTGP